MLLARAKHYKRVAIAGTSAAAIFGAVLTVTTLPLWGLLIVLSLFLIGIFGKAGVLILSGLALLALAGWWLKRKAGRRTEKS